MKIETTDTCDIFNERCAPYSAKWEVTVKAFSILLISTTMFAFISCGHVANEEYNVFYISYHVRFYSPPTQIDVERYGYIIDISSKRLDRIFSEGS